MQNVYAAQDFQSAQRVQALQGLRLQGIENAVPFELAADFFDDIGHLPKLGPRTIGVYGRVGSAALVPMVR